MSCFISPAISLRVCLDGADDELTSIHDAISAATCDAAIAVFTEAANREFPGYELVATLASSLPEPDPAHVH